MMGSVHVETRASWLSAVVLLEASLKLNSIFLVTKLMTRELTRLMLIRGRA
jgi:hypothetical protein